MTEATVPILIMGISGPSCSGKTTLARLLRDVLAPRAFILHEDDFYKTDDDIPVVRTEDGRDLQDWDCLESIDVDGLKGMLEFVKTHGKPKEEFESKEDQNAVGKVSIDVEMVKSWRTKFQDSTFGQARIAVVDGFLLYSKEMEAVRRLFDIKLLLMTDYVTIKRRREARKGYVTLEGFWEDPPGYVDAIVWPNFVKDHKFLFHHEDISKELDEAICRELGIMVMPRDGAEDMSVCFNWACGIIFEKLKALADQK